MEPDGTGSFRARLDKETPAAPLLRGTWKPDGPLRALWSLGKSSPSDIAFGTSASWFFLSQRIQRLFHENGLTGWSAHPIELYDKHGEFCEGYAVLSITGRCGPFDKERAELAPGEDPDEMFQLHTGMYFEPSTWDGSDFCCAGGTSHKVVTESVKILFEEHRINGFNFPPLPEATWMIRKS